MGTWATPFTVDKAKEFVALLQEENPVLPDHAMDKIGSCVGDDLLFDEADHRTKLHNEEAWVDFRAHAIAFVEAWLEVGEEHWNRRFDPEATAICRAAITAWRKRHPGLTAEWLTLDLKRHFGLDE